jgi:ATP-dependent RNA helicase RhlE
MLDLGFIHALKRIVALVPAKRQTLFFSATMPKAIKQLADAYLTNPAEVAVTPAATTVDRIVQSVTHVNQAEKAALLTLFLQKNGSDRTLVFSRTKHGADKIVRQLAAAGIPANAIHGNKSQAQRERALALFRSGEVKVLIATDIAARGIDIPGVSHVINYDLPEVPEQYVHRIGRTARAGADGIAVAFCSPDERGLLRDIERTTRQRIAIVGLPADFASIASHFARLWPAPKAQPQRPQRPSTKADRRHDGQRREVRNDRQRHPYRADGHSGHRSTTQDRTGQRRDEHRTEVGRARSSYRPEAHREASNEQRFPARVDRGQRPSGGQPKRKFHRGPRRRAQG